MRRTDTAYDELQRAWTDWIADMGEWHVFGALTYDLERRFRTKPPSVGSMPGADVVRAHARRWLNHGARALGRPIEAGVLALEYHKNGVPHLHPLLRIAGGLQGDEFATLGRLWFADHGYARLEQPRSREDVCAYASKYLTKDLARGDVLFWPPRGPLSVHQPELA